jgi:ankyrin repeat protein
MSLAQKPHIKGKSPLTNTTTLLIIIRKSMLPEDIIQHELSSFLSFSDVIRLRKTSHFNASFNYNHDPRLDNNYAIKLAAKHANVDATKCLLKVKYVDPGDNYNEPLILAITKKSYDVVQLLLNDTRVNPAIKDNAPLIHAITVCNTDDSYSIVKLLLKDKRVNPATRHNLLLRTASGKGYAEIVRLILKDNRVNPSDLRNEALGNAVNANNTEIVKMLMEYGKFLF